MNFNHSRFKYYLICKAVDIYVFQFQLFVTTDINIIAVRELERKYDWIILHGDYTGYFTLLDMCFTACFFQPMIKVDIEVVLDSKKLDTVAMAQFGESLQETFAGMFLSICLFSAWLVLLDA